MSNRKINIEFIRVFAIALTIMIHVSNVYIYNIGKISHFDYLVAVSYNAISRICVPLFFMISGIFLIKQEYNRQKYFNRIKKYICILIIWSIIYYLIKYNFKFINVPSTLITSLLNANMTSRHLWFMYAIIGIYIALPFIQSMCKNLTKEQENLFLILWAILSGFAIIYVPLARSITKTNIDITYPIPMINSAYYLGYFISGHILYERFKEKQEHKIKNIYLILGYIIPTLVTITVTYIISINKNKVFESMFWFKSIFTIIATSSIFLLILKNEHKIKSPLILKLSKYSFGIYLIHMIFIEIMKRNINILGFNPIVSIPIITVLVYLLSLLSSVIIKRIPLIKNII